MVFMKAHLSFSPLAGIETDLLGVFAADTSASKAKDAKPEIRLLTSDPALQRDRKSVV